MREYDEDERYFEDDLDSSVDEQMEDDILDDFYNNDDLFKDDSAPSKKERKKEYYVKGAELKEELRKYQESKAKSENGQRIYF